MKKIDWSKPLRFTNQTTQRGTPVFIGKSFYSSTLMFYYESATGIPGRVDEYGRVKGYNGSIPVIENVPEERKAYRVLYLNSVFQEDLTRAPYYSVTSISVAELKRTLETLQRNDPDVRIFGVLQSNFVDSTIESLEFIPKESLEEFLKSNT